MDLLKNTKDILEIKRRIIFYDVFRRPPSKQERERIHELVSDHIEHAEMSL